MGVQAGEVNRKTGMDSLIVFKLEDLWNCYD